MQDLRIRNAFVCLRVVNVGDNYAKCRPSSLLVGLVVIERWSHSLLYFGVARSLVND